MEDTDRVFLRQNHVKLIGTLAHGLSDVLEYLWSENIITEDMKDRVSLGTNTKKKQAADLLLLLPTRGPHAFQALYDAAVDSGLHEVANILKPGSDSHFPNYKPQSKSPKVCKSQTFGDDSDDEALPEVWPGTLSEHSKPVELKTYEHASSKEKYQSRYDSHCRPPNIDDYYQMLHKNRGPCIVFSNERFDDLVDRDGNEQDLKRLKTLFQNLGFDVDIISNRKKEEMWQLLKQKVGKLEGKTDIDCFILIILSHGENGVIFGTDGKSGKNSDHQNCITYDDIKDLVAGVKSLRRIPKLFFFQACRGTAKDYGDQQLNSNKAKNGGIKTEPPSNAPTANSSTAVNDQTTGVGSNNQEGNVAYNQNTTSPIFEEAQSMELDGCISMKPPVPEAEDIKNAKEVIDKWTPPETSHDAAGENLPTLANFFIAMSTTAGFLSFRNTKSGSWFIQAIVYVFSRFAYKHDIGTLMTKVNRLISKASDEKGAKQICEPCPYLLKRFYFFPKLYKKDN